MGEAMGGMLLPLRGLNRVGMRSKRARRIWRSRKGSKGELFQQAAMIRFCFGLERANQRNLRFELRFRGMQSLPNEGELLGLFGQTLLRFEKTSHERLADREDRRSVRDDDGRRGGANIARISERARGRNELQSLVFGDPLPCDNAWVRFAFCSEQELAPRSYQCSERHQSDTEQPTRYFGGDSRNTAPKKHHQLIPREPKLPERQDDAMNSNCSRICQRKWNFSSPRRKMK